MIPSITTTTNPNNSNTDNYWQHLLAEIRQDILEGNIAGAEGLMNGLQFLAQAAGGSFEDAFDQLQADLSGNASTATILADLSQLSGAPFPQLSAFDWQMVMSQTLTYLIQSGIMGQSGMQGLLGLLGALGFMSLESGSSLPPQFYADFCSLFSQAVENYQKNPNASTLAALMQQLQKLYNDINS
jgi:hypothetical protein